MPSQSTQSAFSARLRRSMTHLLKSAASSCDRDAAEHRWQTRQCQSATGTAVAAAELRHFKAEVARARVSFNPEHKLQATSILLHRASCVPHMLQRGSCRPAAHTQTQWVRQPVWEAQARALTHEVGSLQAAVGRLQLRGSRADERVAWLEAQLQAHRVSAELDRVCACPALAGKAELDGPAHCTGRCIMWQAGGARTACPRGAAAGRGNTGGGKQGGCCPASADCHARRCTRAAVQLWQARLWQAQLCFEGALCAPQHHCSGTPTAR